MSMTVRNQVLFCLLWFILPSTARWAEERTRSGDTFSHFLGSSEVSPPQQLASVWRTCSGWVWHSAQRLQERVFRRDGRSLLDGAQQLRPVDCDVQNCLLYAAKPSMVNWFSSTTGFFDFRFFCSSNVRSSRPSKAFRRVREPASLIVGPSGAGCSVTG